jgi:cell division protein FtsZ
MTPQPESPLAPPADASVTPPKLAFRIFGLGDAGGKVIDFLAAANLSNMTYIAVNTDTLALAGTSVAHRVQLGAKHTRGLGTGGDPDLGRAAAEHDAETLRQHCVGADIVFIVAGLGGGTGSGASPVLALVAHDAGALVLALAILPFDCEGSPRQRQAQYALQQLKATADGVICVPNQRMAKLVDETTSLVETYRITNQLISQGIRGLWRLVAGTGLMNADFPTVCRALRGQHAESSLATVEAKGPNRVREALEKLLASPLLENGQTLAEASRVLVGVLGGPELSLAEINRITEQLNRHCENAQFTLGANIEPDYRDRLEITVVVAGPGALAEDPPPASRESRVHPDESAPHETLTAERRLFNEPEPHRPASRLVPPPPVLPPEQVEQIFRQQLNANPRFRRPNHRLQQGQLPLEIVPKGRFDKSEPTIHHGEDLDMPTYIRRGVPLN